MDLQEEMQVDFLKYVADPFDCAKIQPDAKGFRPDMSAALKKIAKGHEMWIKWRKRAMSKEMWITRRFVKILTERITEGRAPPQVDPDKLKSAYNMTTDQVNRLMAILGTLTAPSVYKEIQRQKKCYKTQQAKQSYSATCYEIFKDRRVKRLSDLKNRPKRRGRQRTRYPVDSLVWALDSWGNWEKGVVKEEKLTEKEIDKADPTAKVEDAGAKVLVHFEDFSDKWDAWYWTDDLMFLRQRAQYQELPGHNQKVGLRRSRRPSLGNVSEERDIFSNHATWKPKAQPEIIKSENRQDSPSTSSSESLKLFQKDDHGTIRTTKTARRKSTEGKKSSSHEIQKVSSTPPSRRAEREKLKYQNLMK